MSYGQVVIGPPGSGKTTYCNGMSQFLELTGRKVAIVNLDPANDKVPYKADVDIMDLITVEDVMEEFDLGPNGAMIYCMDFLESNFDWLTQRLEAIKDKYILFDCPGQVEVFTHHDSLRKVIERLLKRDLRLCAVSLVDAHHCTDPAKYISVLLLSLQAMIHLEMPFVNVLSKIDLMESYGKLAFDLEYYTEVQDLQQLLPLLNRSAFGAKYRKLNEALVEMIESFNLVAFYTLMIEDRMSVLNLARVIDKANGYAFGGLDDANESIMATGNTVGQLEDVSWVQEKYLNKGRGDQDEEEEEEESSEFEEPDEE